MALGSNERRVMKKAMASSRACAGIAELGAFAGGSLEPVAHARLSEHLATCTRCQTELAMLREFEGAVPRPDEEASVSWISAQLDRRLGGHRAEPGDVKGVRWFRSRSVHVAGLSLAAAMVIIAVTVGLREARRPAIEAITGREVFRSGLLRALSPSGELPEAPRELRWEGSPGAASYVVHLMEVDRAEVWSAATPNTAVALPPEVRARILPGKALLWQVVATDAGGAPLTSSAVEGFRVKRQ